jgi:hypothetical protein
VDKHSELPIKVTVKVRILLPTLGEDCRLWAYQRFYQHLGKAKIAEFGNAASVGIMLPYLYRGKLTFWWPCECLKHIDLGKINLLVHFPSFTNIGLTMTCHRQTYQNY